MQRLHDASGLVLALSFHMHANGTRTATTTRTWDDITSLVDHIVEHCHPATRRALTEACSCADAPVKDSLEAFAAKLEEEIAVDEALLKTVRALAQARAGQGPFPTPPFTAVHSHGQDVRYAHARLNETLRQIRALAQSSSAVTSRALDELVAPLTNQTRLLTNELLPWASGLEPDREHASHRTTKHHARAGANRRANNMHARESFASRDFIHRKRA